MSGGLYVDAGMNQMTVPLLDAAARALRKPRDFMYWGDATPDAGWGWTGLTSAQNEDDALNRSNMRVISADLLAQWPDDVRVELTKHWAVGWIDELRVRVLKNATLGIVESNVTDAFKATLAWAARLADYPVADESDYSDLETEEALAAGMVMCDVEQDWAFPSDCRREGHEHVEDDDG